MMFVLMFFSQHESHIIVAPFEEAKDRASVLRSAYTITIVTAAICTLTKAVGVFWSNSQTLTSAKAAQSAAAMLSKGKIPILQWVRPTVRYSPDGKQTGVFTQGLQLFAQREIEFPPSGLPSETVVQRVLGLVEYLISQGPVIKDGDTVGVSEREHIHVRFAERGLRPDIPVMVLSLSSTQ